MTRRRGLARRYVLGTGLLVVALVVLAIAASLNWFSSPSRPPLPLQAADTKANCIIATPGSTLTSAEQATGIDFDCLSTYSNADTTWAQWVRPWVALRSSPFRRWLATDPSGRSIVDAQSLVPDEVAKEPNWRASCAAGQYDGYARELGRLLVATGFENVTLRLGPEMNGNWYLDSIGDSPTEWHEWARCFAQEVTSLRSVPGEHFLIDWNVNAGYRDIPLGQYYPGNAYVDIVGIDLYDAPASGTLPPVGSPQRFSALAGEPLGLDAVAAFARAHHKPLSIPEWGTESAKGSGDDPAYVAGMARFVATHDVAFQSWFDNDDDGIYPLSKSQAPRSLAAYVAAFGPHGSLRDP
jgi:hypothetical protein